MHHNVNTASNNSNPHSFLFLGLVPPYLDIIFGVCMTSYFWGIRRVRLKSSALMLTQMNRDRAFIKVRMSSESGGWLDNCCYNYSFQDKVYQLPSRPESAAMLSPREEWLNLALCWLIISSKLSCPESLGMWPEQVIKKKKGIVLSLTHLSCFPKLAWISEQAASAHFTRLIFWSFRRRVGASGRELMPWF